MRGKIFTLSPLVPHLFVSLEPCKLQTFFASIPRWCSIPFPNSRSATSLIDSSGPRINLKAHASLYLYFQFCQLWHQSRKSVGLNRDPTESLGTLDRIENSFLRSDTGS